mgnify:FL=1
MRLEFYDTTLRDGAQAAGISYSLSDKKQIFALLSGIGIDLVEGGDPASNPKDAEFFQECSSPRLAAFGSTCRKNTPAQNDEGLCKLLATGARTVCIFGKTSVRHVEEVLHATKEENLRMIRDSVRFLASHGRRVIFDAEHFYDGAEEDMDYALLCIRTAAEAGADTVTLCDTNGGIFPDKAYELTKAAAEALPGVTTGVHFHNDTGTAVASSLAGVRAGARHIQGTFLGFGERCGNANLSTIIADLVLKGDCECGVDLTALTRTAHAVAEISNVKLDPAMPYVGAAAFAHKAGMHSDAVIKDPRTFEHVSPEAVGNRDSILLSEVAGRSAVAKKLERLFPALDKSNPKTKEILDMIKLLEMKGYQFEDADGSFVLLAERMMNAFSPSFELEHYCIKAVRPGGVNTAEVAIRVNGEVTSVSETGNGPVNALDKALRSALIKHFPQIDEVALIDYKVRVVDSSAATGAMVRVLITSSDKKDTWTTVGVSTDIIEASWSALTDSFEYKLTGRGKIV